MIDTTKTGGEPFEEVAPLYDQLMWSVPYKYAALYAARILALEDYELLRRLQERTAAAAAQVEATRL